MILPGIFYCVRCGGGLIATLLVEGDRIVRALRGGRWETGRGLVCTNCCAGRAAPELRGHDPKVNAATLW